jgi:hypothetical protein
MALSDDPYCLSSTFPILSGETFEAYAKRACASGLTLGHRALIAASYLTICRAAQRRYQERKAGWIRAARLDFSPGPRRPCVVCHNYIGLTDAHHSVPLSVQFDSGATKAIHEHDWLCPTHHRAMHVVIDALLDNVQPNLAGMPPQEKDALDPLGVKFVQIYIQLPNPRALRVRFNWND